MVACIHKFCAVISLLVIAIICTQLNSWVAATLIFALVWRLVSEEW